MAHFFLYGLIHMTMTLQFTYSAYIYFKEVEY